MLFDEFRYRISCEKFRVVKVTIVFESFVRCIRILHKVTKRMYHDWIHEIILFMVVDDCVSVQAARGGI